MARQKAMSPLYAFVLGGLAASCIVYTTLFSSVEDCHGSHGHPLAGATPMQLDASPPLAEGSPPPSSSASAASAIRALAEAEAPGAKAPEDHLEQLRTLREKVDARDRQQEALEEQLQKAKEERAEATESAEGYRKRLEDVEQSLGTKASPSTASNWKKPPEGGSYTKVGLAAVADKGHAKKFAVSLASQRCYAEKFGYEYVILDPKDYPKCKQRDFFFKKHCTVARFLETKDSGYILFVLDGDTPAVSLRNNLDAWLAEAKLTDVVVYERWMNNELMAGNYVVRASEWGIKFVDGWAAYDTVDQPRGYHSSDNGAIHMHVIRTLRISKHAHCAYWWEKLSQTSMVLDEYFSFVSCTRLLMGPPRRWKLDGQYRLTIIPRGHAWAIDGGIVCSKISSIGAVLHHGQKTNENYRQYFTTEFVDGGGKECSKMVRDDTYVKKDEYAGFLVSSLKGRLDGGGFLGMAKIAAPPWDFAYSECMGTLSCRPLDDPSPMELRYPRPLQAASAFVRIGKDLKFEKCGKEHDLCTCVGIVKFATSATSSKTKSAFTPVPADKGKIMCNLQSFDNEDPAPGEGKACFCAPQAR